MVIRIVVVRTLFARKQPTVTDAPGKRKLSMPRENAACVLFLGSRCKSLYVNARGVEVLSCSVQLFKYIYISSVSLCLINRLLQKKPDKIYCYQIYEDHVLIVLSALVLSRYEIFPGPCAKNYYKVIIAYYRRKQTKCIYYSIYELIVLNARQSQC